MTDTAERILIERLGAIGDVVNALTVATALKRRARPPEIGWAVHDLSLPLVEQPPAVDRVHLWRKAGTDDYLERPPAELVGPK